MLQLELDSNVYSSAVSAGSELAPASVTNTVTCVDCFTTGYGVVTTTGIKNNGTALDTTTALKELLADPEEFISNALDFELEVSLENISGHFEFDISFGSGGTFTVPLFHPSTPLGVQTPVSLM